MKKERRTREKNNCSANCQVLGTLTGLGNPTCRCVLHKERKDKKKKKIRKSEPTWKIWSEMVAVYIRGVENKDEEEGK